MEYGITHTKYIELDNKYIWRVNMKKKSVTAEEREIGSRVRAIRLHFKLTQEQMADKLGISSISHYQNIEKGTSSVNYRHLKCLKKEFNVSADYILFDELVNELYYEFHFESLPPEKKVRALMNIVSHLCDDNENNYSEIISDLLNENSRE